MSNGEFTNKLRVVRGGRHRRKPALLRRQSVSRDWPAELRKVAGDLQGIADGFRDLRARRDALREQLNELFDAAGVRFSISPMTDRARLPERMAEIATEWADRLEKVTVLLQVVKSGGGQQSGDGQKRLMDQAECFE